MPDNRLIGGIPQKSEENELLEALVLMLISFGVDPDSADVQQEAFENGVQTVEKTVGMPFHVYLQTTS